MKPYLWLYWENEKVPEPGFIQLCRKTIEKHCGGDFEIILTTPENIRKYLPDTKIKFEKIFSMLYSHAAVRAAYIRVALLQRYGGIWLDSDTIVIKSLLPIWRKTEEKGFSTVGRPPYGAYFSNCLLGSVEKGELITKYLRILDEYIANRPPWPGYKNLTYSVPWLQLGTFTLSPLIISYGVEKIHYEPCWKIQPINSGIWQKYFEDLGIEEVLNKLKSQAVPQLNPDSIYCFTLCNQSFPWEFKRESEEEILSKKTLISRLFKRSLNADI